MRLFCALAMAASILAVFDQGPARAEDQDGVSRETALSLATMLRSARSVIGEKQDIINDPNLTDKGITADSVLEQSIQNYVQAVDQDPRDIAGETLEGKLLAAQMVAIQEVIAENQPVINREGVGFKGFVPAVFARLVNERFSEKVGDLATIKVTAPPHLVRNRKSRPDAWEQDIIASELTSPDWTHGAIFDASVAVKGRDAFRVLVPEYYGDGCLACHGGPAGEIDVTGYPKEGGALGDLGGVISITLFR